MKLPVWLPIVAMVLVLGLALSSPVAGQGAIDGYADYQSLTNQVQELAAAPAGQQPLVDVRSLATTLGGREVWLLTIGEESGSESDAATDSASPHDTKPAILVLGNVDATHLVGSELAVRMARLLAEKARDDEAVKQLLSRHALYFIPRPSPDASEAFFRRPLETRGTNDRATDDDRDFSTDEDPCEDLNGDGLITAMRVEDPAGELILHPDDPRVLITADPLKNERGKYRVLSEGRDNDGDEKFNEDRPGGVDFNRNFTFKYPYFEAGAGPHQVSELETRAVADFAFDHPNIALVFSFSPDDNLMHPWKPNASTENQRIKTSVLAADARWLDQLAAKYRDIRGGKGAPDSPPAAGSFAHWAYFHFGRWSLSARGWWIPEVPDGAPARSKDKSQTDDADQPDKSKPDKSQADESQLDENAKPAADATQPDAAKPSTDAAKAKRAEDKRGAAERNALRWFEREKIEGFVPWTVIEHPDFPGRKVEVGGFVPYRRDNPPADQLDDLAQKHLQFLLAVAERLPRLAIEEPQVESLGGGVFRLSVAVVNEGQLPTMPQMGRVSGLQFPVQLQIDVPDGVKLIPSVARVRVEVLAPAGGRHEQKWLVQSTAGTPISAKISAWAPAVGRVTKTVELK
ncbi:MAG: M14 family metallopeptidase [Pirellulales bacterium]